MKKPLPAPTGIVVGEISVNGACSAHFDGRDFVVFGGLPGESVDIQARRKSRGRVHGIATAIQNPSPDRVAPRCGVADLCGGCSLMHMRRERQLAMKEQWLRTEFGEVQPNAWLPWLTGPTHGYRAKARLGVRFVEKRGEVLVGFREKLSGFVTDTRRCAVLAAPADELLGPLRELLNAMQDPRSVPQVEITALEGHLVLVIRHLEPFADEDLALLRAFARAHDADILIQPGGPATVKPLQGTSPRQLSYSLPEFDVTIEVSPADFVQVNTSLNRAMVACVVDLLELDPTDVVADLFCGVGNFGLAVARSAAKVIGCDAAPDSIARANANAARNGVSNAAFEIRDLMADDLHETWKLSAGKVILDPPRSGANAVVPLLVRSEVERVVYVSCNPVTLASDIKALVAGGFRLARAGIMDMFPHTAHVESVVLLERS